MTRSLLLALLVSALPAAAQAPPTAGCDLGEAEAELDAAGVRAALYNIGGLFWRGGPQTYEVPKGSGVDAIFNASLLVGGLVDDELRFAGSTYGPWEFWPGPLAADGTTTPETCAAYDRIWVVSAADLEALEAGGAPTADLAEWPVGVGAPFYVDADGDGAQGAGEPTRALEPGDAGYGTKALDLAAGERPVVFGSQTAWWVMNDAGGVHGWSPDAEAPTVAPLGVEVRVTAWVQGGLDTPALHRSTFYRYEVVNRTAATIRDLHVGLYVDSDLGRFNDDRAGSDSTRQMVVFYNGDDDDEGGDGYGFPPPALAIDALSGAWAGPVPYKNGAYGEPASARTGYNYLRGLWRNGEPVRVGGLGYDTDGPVTRWAFSGDAVAGAFWSQENLDGQGTAATPSDKRAMISGLPATLGPGERTTLDLGILFARGDGRLESVARVRDVSDRAQALYDAGALTAPADVPPPPPAPVPIAPTAGTEVQGERPTFSWEPVPGAEGYRVEVFEGDGAPILRQFVTGTSFTPGARALPLNRRTTLTWEVRALRLGEGPPSARAAFPYFLPAFDRFSVVANADGPLPARAAGFDPRSIAREDQQTNGSSWIIEVLDGVELVGAPAAAAYPRDYEVRFVGDAVGIDSTTGRPVAVPLELWDIGVGTPDDPADDVRLIPVVLDANEDGRFGASTDPDEAGVTDAVAWYAPADFAPGERGFLAAVAADVAAVPPSDRRVLPPLAFSRFRPARTGPTPATPEPGTVIRLESSAQAAPVEAVAPGEALVLDARPNPIGARAVIGYRLAADGPVRLRLVDVLGREVAVLADGDRTEGEHRAALDASRLAAGVYVLELRAGEARATRTMTVVR